MNEIEKLRAALRQLLDCSNAIVGADLKDPEAGEAFSMFDDARLAARDVLRTAQSTD